MIVVYFLDAVHVSEGMSFDSLSNIIMYLELL